MGDVLKGPVAAGVLTHSVRLAGKLAGAGPTIYNWEVQFFCNFWATNLQLGGTKFL